MGVVLLEALIIASVVLLTGCRRLEVSVALLALQSVLLGLMMTLEGHTLVGLATLVIKGIAVPVFLIISLRGLDFKPKHGLLAPVKQQVLVAMAMVVLAYWLASSPQGVASLTKLAPAMSLIFIGVLLMIFRSKTVSQVVGLLVIENGIALSSVQLAGGLPRLVEFGILFDVAVAAALMAFVSTRIGKEYGSLDTSKLNDLRG